MRIFWTLLLLGSMLLVGLDVVARRQTPLQPPSPTTAGDGIPIPTPRP